MSVYPSTVEERRAMRRQIRDRLLQRAEAELVQIHRSSNCAYALVYGGSAVHSCRNDGSTCICECHDPRAAS